MKKLKYIIGVLFLLVIIWFTGAKPETPIYSNKFPSVNLNLNNLEDSINKAELSNPGVKINNEVRIIWADSTKTKTDWSIVYLHGFTASQMEGDPVHRVIAAEFGMNLYLARLNEHGLESDSALLHMTPESLWETSKTALAIGEALGNKVILMSTSTGGTLALKLAETYPGKVAALINYSPNVAINNAFTFILNDRWGLSILNMMSNNGYIDKYSNSDSLISQYWTVKYKTEALPQLQELLETTMTESVFSTIKCPSLTLAYYKDEEHQDPTVKVSAMRWMHESLGTPADLKKFVEMPTVGVHPMASSLRSKDIEAVIKETKLFIKETLLVDK
ncbi:MAG: alpha/beta hydrolase [Cyclobacteriaceae bacterium]|nr:alpha/beta hydrolase [Cyclobacteriaceae bacterium]